MIIDTQDLIGKKFGRLTIINAERKKMHNDAHNYIYVIAECECGNVIECRLAALKNVSIQSCGCMHKEKVTKIYENNIIGKKFGLLTILSMRRDRSSQIIVTAQCECGSIKEYRYSSIKRGTTKSCGCGLLKRKQAEPKICIDNFIGKKFGKLTIIDTYRNENSEIIAKVQCECGNIKECRYRSLTYGHITSCGCKNRINKSDIIGKKFNHLTVLEVYKKDRTNFVKAKCDCGSIKEYRLTTVRSGHTKSCGCLMRKANGHSEDRLYKIWKHMLDRCYNSNNIRYADWGGRGIRVCDEWKNSYDIFKTWANVNGYADTLSIDRIDNDKNYCPENCHWVTTKEQNRNKRNSLRIMFHGEDVSLKTLCEELDINYSSIKNKYKNGVDVLPILEEKYHLLCEVK